MRQCGRESGEEEPVDAEGDHHEREQRDAAVTDGDDRSGPEHRDDAHQIAGEEDLSATPSVEEDTGERTENAERQQHRRQGRGYASRIGLAFG